MPTLGAGQLQTGDTVTGRSQAFASKNVLGSGNSTLNVTAYTVNDGNSGNNYTVSTHTASGTISKASLDISAVSDSKTYDGTTSSTGMPTLGAGQLQTGDTVTGRSQAFSSKNVLGSEIGRASGRERADNDGDAGNNYTVSTHTASGTISTARLAISAGSESKTYDGTR